MVYDDYSETYSPLPRIKAVIDPFGRIAKFYYQNPSFPRYITKIEFGKGTVDALSEIYQTAIYGYTAFSTNQLLTSAQIQLAGGDPRGTELVTNYEYSTLYLTYAKLNAIVDANGNRVEYQYSDFYFVDGVAIVKVVDGTTGQIRRSRSYTKVPWPSFVYPSVQDTNYYNGSIYQPRLFATYSAGDIAWMDHWLNGLYRLNLWYDEKRNVITKSYTPNLYDTTYEFVGTNNQQMGNPTKIV